MEWLINGCALTAKSYGPHGLQPITPSHFIMQKKTTCLSPGSFGRADQFHQRKWRQVQFLADLFWKRCLREYLPSLQNREKWHGALPNLKQNALVSLANENTSRGRRNLGRIGQKLHHLESNYKDLRVQHDVGPSTLGVPWGAECLGTNIVLVNTFQDLSSVSLLFSHQFSHEISLHI